MGYLEMLAVRISDKDEIYVGIVLMWGQIRCVPNAMQLVQ